MAAVTIGNHDQWTWVEEQDADQWLKQNVPQHLKEQLSSVLRFDSAELDGEATCHTRRGTLVAPFYYDVVLKDCHWTNESHGDVDITFQVQIFAFSSQSDTSDFRVNFREYPKEISDETRHTVSETILAAAKDLNDKMIGLFTEALENKKRGKVEPAVAGQTNGSSSNSKSQANGDTAEFRHEETIGLPADMVFKCFTDQDIVCQLTERLNSIHPVNGSSLSLLDGHITGTVVDCDVAAHTIKLQLCFSDWPTDATRDQSVLSLSCAFVDSATKLTLTHTGVPRDHLESVKAIWLDMFVKRIPKFYGLCMY